MKRIDDHCSLLAFKLPTVTIVRLVVYEHRNFLFLSRHIFSVSVKIPNDEGLTRFALDFDLLKDLDISSNL